MADLSNLKEKSGIYYYRNMINEKKYVGQAVDLYKRISGHERNFKKEFFPTTENKALWSAVKKYGRDNFEFFILEICERDKLKLDFRESFYIRELKSHVSEWGYNILKEGFSRLGVSPSKETRLKIGLGNRGKTVSQEARTKISIAKTGVPRSADCIEKMAKSKRGKKLSEAHIKKLSESKLGKKLKNSSSNYIGVSFDRFRKKWISGISLFGKRKNLGRHDSEIESARAYDNYVLKNNLKNPINFPQSK